MANRSNAEIARVRAAASEIILQLQSDPAFAEKVKENPVGTLESAGIPEGSINDFLREIDSSDEVGGYVMRSGAISATGATRTALDSCSFTCIFTTVF